MVLIVALSLIGAVVVWWIARSKTQPKTLQIAAQRPTSDGRSSPPALRTDSPAPRTYVSAAVLATEPKLTRPYAEIADPNGGVREISAEEVTALFQPIRTKLASLRKLAANSTRVAQAFGQSGGVTPNVETYRRAYREAVALAEKAEELHDTILFESEADSTKYYDLLERVVDVEVKLEENLAIIANVETEIASGVFLPTEVAETAKRNSGEIDGQHPLIPPQSYSVDCH